MNKRVERFLRNSKRLHLIEKETDFFNHRMVYSVGFRWSILKITMINKIIRLTLIKIDGSITRVEVSVIQNGEQITGAISTRTSQKLLNNLTYI